MRATGAGACRVGGAGREHSRVGGAEREGGVAFGVHVRERERERERPWGMIDDAYVLGLGA